MLGSAEAINYPRLNNSSPTDMMRTFTPEPQGFRQRRELPREPWRQQPHQSSQLSQPQIEQRPPRRDPLSFEQAVALGRQ